MTMKKLIEKECEALKEFLLKKNRAYGNSALEPVRIFSKADPVEQLNVRIDDKLSRLARGKEYDGDDTLLDLIGYLLLLRIALRKEPANDNNSIFNNPVGVCGSCYAILLPHDASLKNCPHCDVELDKCGIVIKSEKTQISDDDIKCAFCGHKVPIGERWKINNEDYCERCFNSYNKYSRPRTRKNGGC